MEVILATEDLLSEEVCVRLIREYPGLSVSNTRFRKDGFGYLKERINAFVEISRQRPIFLLTDLDSCACPIKLKQKWLKQLTEPKKLIFRVAVREVEAWLLADHDGMSSWMKISKNRLPSWPDELNDPKAFLLNLARRAPKEIKSDLLPEDGSCSRQGLGYNNRMKDYVHNVWDPSRAAKQSPSLMKAMNRLSALAKDVAHG